MKKIIYLLLSVYLFNGCSLDETVYSSLGESNYFKNESDAEALLNSAYAPEQRRSFRNYLIMAEIPAGVFYDRNGGLEALAKPFELFTWDATHEFFSSAWQTHYQTVYCSNLILDQVPAINMDENIKEQILAEARFLRASAYVILDDLFGPVPLILTSNTSATDKPSRPSEEEFNSFIETEFRAVSKILPATPRNYGRATKGAALSQLTKFYLNNKKWKESAETAKEVIDLGIYALYDSPHRTDLFDPLNEVNSEFIYIRPNLANSYGTNFIGHVAPPSYKWKGNTKENYATQFKTYTSFYNSFEEGDERRDAFITQYENLSGQIVQLGKDDIRNFKFQEDLTASGANSGNDYPVIRYADILLSRAEALNELSGPNEESVGLINQVRLKAKIKPLLLQNYSSTKELRDAIFQERGWEFFSEELRCQDLIRQGVFIQQAKDRGIVAVKDYHVLYPIPLSEINLNPNLKQNEGY